MRYTTIFGLVTLALFAACGNSRPDFDRAAHESDVLEWRKSRLERLKSPTGYLNLAGLFWLDPGRSSFGSSEDNDLVFPESAPARIGVFELSDDGVMMTTEAGVEVFWDETRVSSVKLEPDTSENPMLIRHGSLAWMVIERAGTVGVRLRDYDNPAIATFPDIEYFAVDPSLRIEGTLKLYDEPRVIDVKTVIEGLGYYPQSPGVVEFEIAAEKFELEAYASGERLFFVFGDRTSGRETYPAGRFLYSDKPGDDGKTVLDFNFAYNPPCAFNDFATCPVASPRNRMAVRIEAGEKYNKKLHATPGGKH